jgi:hypothetical protein
VQVNIIYRTSKGDVILTGYPAFSASVLQRPGCAEARSWTEYGAIDRILGN